VISWSDSSPVYRDILHLEFIAALESGTIPAQNSGSQRKRLYDVTRKALISLVELEGIEPTAS